MATDDVISASKSRLETLIEPINGGVGADISYDEAFDKLKNEVDKMQSLSGGKVDWGGIISGADEILTDKSKDFRVALYYAAGKAQLDGMTGLLDGLVLLNELTNAFWDTMYPSLKRPKARGNLAVWYSDAAAAVASNFKTTSKDADLVGAIDEVSRALDSTLRDKLGDAYSGMANLRNAIRSLVANTPKEAPPPPPPPPPPPKVEAPAAPPPPPPPAAAAAPAAAAPAAAPVTYAAAPAALPSAAAITDVDSAISVIGQCSLLLTRAGDALRVADPANPAAYRIGRTGTWLELSQAPVADDGKTTIFPAPGLDLRARLDAIAGAENWVGLIGAADEIGAENILWLDPQRYIAFAMDKLGAPYAAAKQALILELGYMLLRAPTLPEMTFNDGTPFADDQTRAWIDAEVRTALGSGGGGGARSYVDGPLGEANTLVGGGDLPGALTVLFKATAQAPSPADRFKCRLAAAKLCLQAEQYAIARAQLDGLEKQVDQYGLIEWDPGLCAELYLALYTAHRGTNIALVQAGEMIPDDVRARERIAFERLCQLDAGAAVKLMTGA
jgi:type VI secretion system protein VasJ